MGGGVAYIYIYMYMSLYKCVYMYMACIRLYRHMGDIRVDVGIDWGVAPNSLQ